MMTDEYTLRDLKLGESMVVRSLTGEDAMRRRLEDLGLTEGARVTCLMKSPLGDPRAYWIRGAVIALRDQDAATVTGNPVEAESLSSTERMKRSWD